METIRILLVDDHSVVRSGLGQMLGLEEDIKVVGEASNSEEALKIIDLVSPDIILMDIKMPGMDGVRLTKEIKEKLPSCNIIMFTLHGDYLTQAVEAGATGYLLKDIKREDLVRAIRKVYSGQTVISENIQS
ncbi:MAG TPA: response regulator transcription factor [Dehalococcoidia bacterium]|nr:response regulator transcription factor [Dehalococcoidia bacterium]